VAIIGKYIVLIDISKLFLLINASKIKKLYNS